MFYTFVILLIFFIVLQRRLNKNLTTKKSLINSTLFLITLESFLFMLSFAIQKSISKNLDVLVVLLFLEFAVFFISKRMGFIETLSIRFSEMTIFVIMTQLSAFVYFTVIMFIQFIYTFEAVNHILFFASIVLIDAISIYTLELIQKYINHETIETRKRNLKEDMMPIIHQIRACQHEYAHLLSALNYSENVPKSYLELKEESKDYEQFIRFGSQMPMIRASLYLKARQLKQRGIHMEVFSELGIEEIMLIKLREYEIVIVITNLIDNGKEAIINHPRYKEDGFEGIMEVHLLIVEGRFIIKVGNSHNTIIESEFELWMTLGYTSKTDKESHGYGLHNIRNLLNKYDGKIFIEENNKLQYIVLEF